MVLFHRVHNVVFNVVFFLSKRKINFKHLIACWVDVEAKSPWDEIGSYRQYNNLLIVTIVKHVSVSKIMLL